MGSTNFVSWCNPNHKCFSISVISGYNHSDVIITIFVRKNVGATVHLTSVQGTGNMYNRPIMVVALTVGNFKLLRGITPPATPVQPSSIKVNYQPSSIKVNYALIFQHAVHHSDWPWHHSTVDGVYSNDGVYGSACCVPQKYSASRPRKVTDWKGV